MEDALISFQTHTQTCTVAAHVDIRLHCHRQVVTATVCSKAGLLTDQQMCQQKPGN